MNVLAMIVDCFGPEEVGLTPFGGPVPMRVGLIKWVPAQFAASWEPVG